MIILKRSIVLILCLLLLSGVVPAGMLAGIIPLASAADTVESGECGENVTYTLDSDGLLTISGTGDMAYPDEEWNEWQSPFGGNTAIKSVVIENGVTSVGLHAFYGCAGLEDITIPDSVTDILPWAFADCVSLEIVVIPEAVTEIAAGVFAGCTGLTDITIPDSVTAIHEAAFGGCKGLESITIPGSVTSIYEQAFNGCSGLKNLNIPEGVRHIDYSAFAGCTGLVSVAIPDSLTYIEDEVFAGCDGLEIIILPDSLGSVGESAIPEQAVVIGNHGTFAETWASENEREFIAFGDVNADGKILANDARLVLRVSALLEILSGQQTATADVNQDGVILADDARQILRRSAMLEDKWYIGDEGDTVPENDMNLSVSASETVYIGDAFDVAITADSVEGLEALNIELSYDKSIFEYVDSSSSTGVTGGPEDGLLTFAMMSMTCLSGEAENYELARFTLKACGTGSFVFEPKVKCCKGINLQNISAESVTVLDPDSGLRIENANLYQITSALSGLDFDILYPEDSITDDVLVCTVRTERNEYRINVDNDGSGYIPVKLDIGSGRDIPEDGFDVDLCDITVSASEISSRSVFVSKPSAWTDDFRTPAMCYDMQKNDDDSWTAIVGIKNWRDVIESGTLRLEQNDAYVKDATISPVGNSDIAVLENRELIGRAYTSEGRHVNVYDTDYVIDWITTGREESAEYQRLFAIDFKLKETPEDYSKLFDCEVTRLVHAPYPSDLTVRYINDGIRERDLVDYLVSQGYQLSPDGEVYTAPRKQGEQPQEAFRRIYSTSYYDFDTDGEKELLAVVGEKQASSGAESERFNAPEFKLAVVDTSFDDGEMKYNIYIKDNWNVGWNTGGYIYEDEGDLRSFVAVDGKYIITLLRTDDEDRTATYTVYEYHEAYYPLLIAEPICFHEVAELKIVYGLPSGNPYVSLNGELIERTGLIDAIKDYLSESGLSGLPLPVDPVTGELESDEELRKESVFCWYGSTPDNGRTRIIHVIDNTGVYEKYYKPGDIDGDGKVLANDARLALRASAQLVKLSGWQTFAADVDGSGIVLANDARKILRVSAKLEKFGDDVSEPVPAPDSEPASTPGGGIEETTTRRREPDTNHCVEELYY